MKKFFYTNTFINTTLVLIKKRINRNNQINSIFKLDSIHWDTSLVIGFKLNTPVIDYIWNLSMFHCTIFLHIISHSFLLLLRIHFWASYTKQNTFIFVQDKGMNYFDSTSKGEMKDTGTSCMEKLHVHLKKKNFSLFIKL